jgi:tetratricopeptide (TPR) repeat protein
VTFLTSLAFVVIATVASPQAIAGIERSASIDHARADFEAGRYADAASALESMTKSEPEDAMAYYWLGRARLEQGDYRHAIDAFTRAVNLDSDNSEYFRWLGRAEGEVADREHSFSAARRVRPALEKSVRVDPSNVAARRDLMGFYLEAPWLMGGSDGKAWSQVLAIAAIDPMAGHLARAAYWTHKNDTNRAKAEYGAVVEAGPREIGPYIEAAEFYERTRDAAGLRVIIDLAAKIDSNEPQLMYFRGVLAVLSGIALADAEEALRAYAEGVPRRSDRPAPSAARDWLGQVYEALGRPDEAATEFKKALALDPNRKSARESLRRLEQQKK